MSAELTGQDRKLLRRLKLGLFTATLIFIIHALPGSFMPEIYPITRWAMFSEPQNWQHYANPTLDLRVIDTAGRTHAIPYYELFARNRGKNGTTLGLRILRQAPSNALYQRAILDYLTWLYRIDVAEVQIWESTYPRDMASLLSGQPLVPVAEREVMRFTPALVGE